MKYIDADKLIAEIKIIHSSLENREVRCNQVKKIRTECMIEFCKAISEAITSLQQEPPKVDLEKEITEHAQNMPHGEFTHDSECREDEEWAMKEFRYFYEFGLNARKV